MDQTTKLKNQDLFTLVDVINRLDPPTGKSNWTFSGKTRFAFAKNLRRLRTELDVVEATRQGLIRQFELKVIPDKNGGTLEGEKLEDYKRAFSEVLQAPASVQLHMIPEEDLDLDKNQIPSTLLDPLLDTLIKVL